MKLQKGIVLGEGRKLALAVGLVALATGAAYATTYYSGKGDSTTGSTLSKIVKWYTDEGLTTLADPQPKPTANDDNTYVFLESMKMTSNCTFPAGTHVWFGTSAKRWKPNCQSVKWTIPDCTIYGISYLGNSGNAGGFYGSYRLVKTSQTMIFGSANMKDNTTLGLSFSGTFTGESDVVIAFSIEGGYTGDGVNSYSDLRVDGDFSGYKGKFSVNAWTLAKVQTGGNILHFKSASSMGDPSSPFTNAVTLRHRSMLWIDEAVTQTSARGITLDLSDGQFASLYAPNASDSWTLRAPLYGCAAGTLKKDGAGTVTLAGSMTATNLCVEAGTLVVDTTATFAANTHITVKAGGKLVSRVGTNLPAYTLEEGGKFSFDFTVPYENGTTTALDYSDMTSADYGLMTKPIDVALSGKILFPVNTTQELACVRFPSGLVQVTDFTNATEKTISNLPNAWLKVVPDTGAGEDVLTLVVKPAIVRTGRDVYRPLTHQYTYSRTTSAYTETPVWSDGLAAHPGADYVHTNGCEIWSWDAYDGNTRTFPGDSLYLTSKFSMKSARLVIPNLTLDGASFTDVAGSPTLHRYAGGPFTLNSAITFSGNSDKGTVYSYSIEAELLGNGDLTLSSPTNTGVVVYVTGTNRNYRGKVTVTNAKTPTGPAQGTVVSIASPHGLGGALPSATWNGVSLDKYSLIRPQTTMTLETENRGIGISSSGGGFDVPEGAVLTVKQRVRLNPNSSCVLYKEGAGTLILAGEVRHGYAGTNLVDGTNNRLQVDAGFLRAEGTNSYSTLRIAFADGTGVEVDPEATGDVKTFGLCTLHDFAPLEVGGKVLVKPVPTFDIEGNPLFSAAVCTVPASHADLTDTLTPANIHGYTGRIQKDAETYASEGLVTYTATWAKTGLTVIFR